MADKVYYPETIESQTLPGTEVEESASTETSNSKVDSNPARSPVNVRFPIKSVAVETMSSSFNTKTKKILGNFTFGVIGAISIGEYVNGVSGEVKISPNGIMAKNVNGDTTFALDATTGDATFKGILTSGTLISGGGNVVIEEGGTGGRIVLYNDEVPSIVIGDPS